MNFIKRKKEVSNALLTYKFGIYKEISEKLILTSQINKRIILGKYILHECLKNEYPKKIINLLITEDNLNISNKEGTPLNIAIIYDLTIDIIRLLITEDNLNIIDKYGDTPLHNALISDPVDQDIVELLITKENLNIQNEEGDTPLLIALYNKYSEEVIRLLITKENLKMRNYEEGDSPYDIAKFSYGCPKELIALLKID